MLRSTFPARAKPMFPDKLKYYSDNHGTHRRKELGHIVPCTRDLNLCFLCHRCEYDNPEAGDPETLSTKHNACQTCISHLSQTIWLCLLRGTEYTVYDKHCTSTRRVSETRLENVPLLARLPLNGGCCTTPVSCRFGLRKFLSGASCQPTISL